MLNSTYYNMFELSLTTIIVALCSYLFGSISTSIMLAKSFNLPDPRTQGSFNAGATNMLRIGGKKVAALTLVFDMLKGVLPILLAMYLGCSLAEQALIGLCTIMGHIFPLFFGFRGGKGVATFIGALITLNIYSGLVFVGIWLFIAKIMRISSISAIIATILAPIYFYFFTQNISGGIIIGVISIVIIVKHKSNIIRLLHNQEDNINVR